MTCICHDYKNAFRVDVDVKELGDIDRNGVPDTLEIYQAPPLSNAPKCCKGPSQPQRFGRLLINGRVLADFHNKDVFERRPNYSARSCICHDYEKAREVDSPYLPTDINGDSRVDAVDICEAPPLSNAPKCCKGPSQPQRFLTLRFADLYDLRKDNGFYKSAMENPPRKATKKSPAPPDFNSVAGCALNAVTQIVGVITSYERANTTHYGHKRGNVLVVKPRVTRKAPDREHVQMGSAIIEGIDNGSIQGDYIACLKRGADPRYHPDAERVHVRPMTRSKVVVSLPKWLTGACAAIAPCEQGKHNDYWQKGIYQYCL